MEDEPDPATPQAGASIVVQGGAFVVGTVQRRSDLSDPTLPVEQAIALDDRAPAAAIRQLGPDGVDRIVEVSFSDNVDLDAAVIKTHGVIATYATSAERPTFPFWPLLFENVTIRLLGSDDFPPAAKQHAATDLTGAARAGALSIETAPPMPLGQLALAHDRVDAGTRARIVLDPSR